LILPLISPKISLADEIPQTKRVVQASYGEVQIIIPSDSGSEEERKEALDLAELTIVVHDGLLSPFLEGSDIYRLNNAKAGEKIKVNVLTILAVQIAISYSEDSMGLFEPTIGPVRKLYQFDSDTFANWPTPDEIQNALAKVGVQNLVIDEDNNEISFTKDGCSLDLQAFAKAYAIDQAIRSFVMRGFTNAIISAGSTSSILGIDPRKKPDDSWTALFTDPWGNEKPGEITNKSQAWASSETALVSIERDGIIYSNVLDPRNGKPVEKKIQVVLVRRPYFATEASVLAQTFYVLGLQGTEDFLRKHAQDYFADGLTAIMIEKGEGDSTLNTTFELGADGELTVTRK
jgi:thiamine biosynthesis lipoprotein